MTATHTTSTTNSELISGTFRDRESAERAYDSLVSRGYTKDEINVIMSDDTRKKHFSKTTVETELGTKVAAGGLTGATVGETTGGIAGVLSLMGGWRGPFVEQAPILDVVYLFAKAMFLYWVIMWVKYSLPRVRIDHMLDFHWKLLTPLALVLVMATAIVDKILVSEWLGVSAGSLTYTFWMLVMNLLIGWATLSLLRTYAHMVRIRVGEPKPVAGPELSGVKPAGITEV